MQSLIANTTFEIPATQQNLGRTLSHILVSIYEEVSADKVRVPLFVTTGNLQPVR